ncbi:MAG: hypothetical protein ACYCPS_01790 [Candidatus Saccharimonadales bacterium]
MFKDLSILLRNYALYLFSFVVFAVTFSFVSLLVKVSLSGWTLPTSFLLFNLVLITYFVIKKKRSYIKYVLLAATIASLSFLLLGLLTSRTYDLSYDGMYYDEPAIIALAEGWNPIYQSVPSKLHINQQFALQLVEGSPKAVWVLESDIYKLSGNINSATSLNLVFIFIALIFVYRTLRQLEISKKVSIILSLLIVFIEVAADQLFSFREDNISYDLILIVSASLVMLIKESKERALYYWCLLSALILLFATKLSNLIVVAPILIVFIFFAIKRKWYREKVLRLILVPCVVLAFIMLVNPYVTNIFRYKAIDYPYNLTSVSSYSYTITKPGNIRHDNKFDLLMYGIFSRVNNNDTTTKLGNAQLKVPFSFNQKELIAESDSDAKSSGGYGIFFSGLIIISIVLYIYLLAHYKKDRKVIKWLSLALIVVLAAGLLNPVPNYSRYSPEIELIPVLIAIAWVIIRYQTAKHAPISLPIKLFITLILVNVALSILLVLAKDAYTYNILNQQLESLRVGSPTYSVYAEKFYSNYNLLQQHGVNIIISPKPLNCSNKLVLDYSRNSTMLCKTNL